MCQRDGGYARERSHPDRASLFCSPGSGTTVSVSLAGEHPARSRVRAPLHRGRLGGAQSPNSAAQHAQAPPRAPNRRVPPPPPCTPRPVERAPPAPPFPLPFPGRPPPSTFLRPLPWAHSAAHPPTFGWTHALPRDPRVFPRVAQPLLHLLRWEGVKDTNLLWIQAAASALGLVKRPSDYGQPDETRVTSCSDLSGAGHHAIVSSGQGGPSVRRERSPPPALLQPPPPASPRPAPQLRQRHSN